MEQSKIIAFNLDQPSLTGLRDAFPGFVIEAVDGAAAPSQRADWDPGTIDLFVVQSGDEIAQTLELCRSLASSAVLAKAGPVITDSQEANPRKSGLRAGPPDGQRRTRSPILVLLPQIQMKHLRDVLKAGAHTCLALPINAKDVTSMLAHAQAGNQPGRHTLNLERAQIEDRWRDDGGEG
jgi:hypothetical protein